MKLEVPEFKRCFCCIPLRYGLLFWGYVKLIASFILLGLLISLTIITTNRIQRLSSENNPIHKRMSYFIWDIVAIVLLTLLVLLEISINIVFIVGGHKKSPILMKVFYYYNIVILCLYIFGFAVSTTIEMMFELPFVMRSTEAFPMTAFYFRVKIGAGIFNTVLQLYFILLTRSEVRKLQNHTTFRFNNIAAEAECKMESEDRHIEQHFDENTDKMTAVEVNEANVIRNNNINHEKDEKLKLNKYQKIKNAYVE